MLAKLIQNIMRGFDSSVCVSERYRVDRSLFQVAAGLSQNLAARRNGAVGRSERQWVVGRLFAERHKEREAPTATQAAITARTPTLGAG